MEAEGQLPPTRLCIKSYRKDRGKQIIAQWVYYPLANNLLDVLCTP